MSAPIHVLDSVQVGIETTRGTLVPATAILDHDPGGVTLKRNPNIIRVRNAGSLATSHRTYPGRDQVLIEVSGAWTYNWAPWWFNLFLGPLATGTGASADKTWTFGSAVVSDVADNLKSASMELTGKETRPAEYKVAGCVGQSLSLSIKQDAVWTYKATLFGTVLTIAAKTGSLSTVASSVDVWARRRRLPQREGARLRRHPARRHEVQRRHDSNLGRRAFSPSTGSGTRTGSRHEGTLVSAKVVMEYTPRPSTPRSRGHRAALRIESLGRTLGGGNYKCNLDILASSTCSTS